MNKLLCFSLAVLAIEVAAQYELQVYTQLAINNFAQCEQTGGGILYGSQHLATFPLNECSEVTYLGTNYYISANCNVTDETLASLGMEYLIGSHKEYAHQLLYYKNNCSSTPLVLTTGITFGTESACYTFNPVDSPGSLLVRFQCPISTAALTSLHNALLFLVGLCLVFVH
jgi:hypothetical protein